MSQSRKQPLANLMSAMALIAVLTVGYVASYPVVLKYSSSNAVAHTPGYQPVEWLIDETPLSKPIWWWSEVCGADVHVTVRCVMRLQDGLPPVSSSSGDDTERH